MKYKLATDGGGYAWVRERYTLLGIDRTEYTLKAWSSVRYVPRPRYTPRAGDIVRAGGPLTINGHTYPVPVTVGRVVHVGWSTPWWNPLSTSILCRVQWADGRVDTRDSRALKLVER